MQTNLRTKNLPILRFADSNFPRNSYGPENFTVLNMRRQPESRPKHERVFVDNCVVDRSECCLTC